MNFEEFKTKYAEDIEETYSNLIMDGFEDNFFGCKIRSKIEKDGVFLFDNESGKIIANPNRDVSLDNVSDQIFTHFKDKISMPL